MKINFDQQQLLRVTYVLFSCQGISVEEASIKWISINAFNSLLVLGMRSSVNLLTG